MLVTTVFCDVIESTAPTEKRGADSTRKTAAMTALSALRPRLCISRSIPRATSHRHMHLLPRTRPSLAALAGLTSAACHARAAT
ncbi:hypothetical protein N658DRAFT_457145 [Parathielavia hyrcaniae]|uniref:Uncharacterized protein n=1 Tax=Parathielavia hyrcaniae TaxID=113614 RepID=A0AAN6PXU8_9PEZI|nr:hypothetical protein N658DRAFT_457145 [Parathielavia hyrcaniae]